jgi:hypothetical protein
MKLTEIDFSKFLRALAAFRVVIGLAILAFVAVLVLEFTEHPFLWGAVGGVILLSLKGWFALILGYRVLRQGKSARIRSMEWTAFGIGYCIVASAFLVAVFAGEGWVYGLFAVFFATMTPLWFILGRRAEK